MQKISFKRKSDFPLESLPKKKKKLNNSFECQYKESSFFIDFPLSQNNEEILIFWEIEDEDLYLINEIIESKVVVPEKRSKVENMIGFYEDYNEKIKNDMMNKLQTNYSIGCQLQEDFLRMIESNLLIQHYFPYLFNKFIKA